MTPFVSVLCPTRDRREFLPQLLRCYRQQAWPADRMELIVVDDGRDRVGDLLDAPDVRYEALDTRVPLGTKRNRLCELARGEILVNMDDDDWHPPDRVARSVALLEATGAQVVGKSEMAFYDCATDRIHQYPKIGDKHATAGSMAFLRTWWEQHRWAPDPHTEERQFLANFTARLAQFPCEAWEVVLCVAHGDNALPKNTRMPVVPLRLEDVVPDEAARAFYRSRGASDW
ncbi:MAG TPA: glycosyltransferase family 2 protein [Myxococcota bacterium]|nr:glycosyltransferase family 2 protein [Myxococcota bacterium]